MSKISDTMKYSIWIEFLYNQPSLIISTNDLNHAILYVKKENEKCQKEWTGDAKVYFIRRGVNEWSFDGYDWEVDERLCYFEHIPHDT